MGGRGSGARSAGGGESHGSSEEDRCAQGRQGLQGFGVASGLKMGIRLRNNLLHGGKQGFFGLFNEQHLADMGIHHLFGVPRLFEDIADALVGSRQRRSFG